MKTALFVAAALTASVALTPTSASAFFAAPKYFGSHGFKYKHFHKPKYHHMKPHKGTSQVGGKKGGGFKVGHYAMGVAFCSAGSLVLRAMWVNYSQNRELTQGEAWESVGDCVLPFIGGAMFRNFAESYKH